MSLYRDAYINSITDTLSFICFQVEGNNSIHLFDINTHSETFYANLLNLIFDWNLINANYKEMNTAGIDLIDKTNKIAVQVTSDSSSDKIKNTINIFKQYHFYETYDSLFIFIILMNHPKYTTQFKTDDLFVFTKSEHILCVKKLIKRINTLSTEKLKSISAYLSKEVNIYRTPPKRSIFCEFIKNLSNIISENEPLTSSFDFIPFDIEEKIKYNSLRKYRTIVDDYGLYYSACEYAFDTLAGNTKKTKTSLLLWIREKYIFIRNELLKDIASPEDFLPALRENSDIIIDMLKDDIVEFLDQHAQDDELSIEDMQYCCPYFLCYAFCSCKILERPDSHDNQP